MIIMMMMMMMMMMIIIIIIIIIIIRTLTIVLLEFLTLLSKLDLPLELLSRELLIWKFLLSSKEL